MIVAAELLQPEPDTAAVPIDPTERQEGGVQDNSHLQPSTSGRSYVMELTGMQALLVVQYHAKYSLIFLMQQALGGKKQPGIAFIISREALQHTVGLSSGLMQPQADKALLPQAIRPLCMLQ